MKHFVLLRDLYSLSGKPDETMFAAFKNDFFGGGVDEIIRVDTINEYTSASGVTIDGVLLKDGTVTTTAPTIKSVDPAITATGTDDTDGYALTEELNIITSGAADTGVELPTAVVGLSITVVNLTTTTKKVYAGASDAIDDQTVTTGYVTLQAEDSVTFNCYTTALWQSDFEGDAVYGTLYVDTVAENTSGTGVTIDGVLLKDGYGTFTLAATGTVTIDGATTKHTGATALDINLDVNSASSNALDIDVDVDTALSGGEFAKGVYVDVLSAAADVDASSVLGVDVLMTSTALSKADVIAFKAIIAGTATAASGTADIRGFQFVPTLTMNSSSTNLRGINVDLSGMTNTTSASSYGIYVNSTMTTAQATSGVYVTDGTRVASLVTSTLALALTGSTKITGTGVTTGHILEIDATALTSGSLVDYVGITTKTSGYLFNGSMTTSTIDASFLADDFSVSCAHDGVAADTLRMIRRIWSGALPNGTLAADFAVAEFSFSGTAGTAASKSGSVTGLKVDLGSATINDSSLTAYGLYVDATVTNTLSTAIYGVYATVVSTGTAGYFTSSGSVVSLAAATTAVAVGTSTIGISIGNCPTGISFTDVGATTEHLIDVVDAYTGLVIETGSYSSSASKGVTVNATNARPASFLFDDAGAAFTAGDIRPLLGRTALTISHTAGSVRLASNRGHLKVASGLELSGGASEFFATEGLIEAAGTMTIGNATDGSGMALAQAAGVCGMLWLDGTATTTGILAGVMAKLYQTAGTTSATCAAFAVTTWWNSTDTWGYGLYIPSSTVAVGMAIGSCTTVVELTSATNVTNLFKFDAAAGCILNVDVSPNDTPSDGGLGADACIRVDIAGQDYFIPLFAVELS